METNLAAMMVAPFALNDEITFNFPSIGLGLGWIVSVWFVQLLMRGKLHSQAAWDAREREWHAEVERVDHDRQEWRSESRIKDAQHAEKDTQIGELQKQVSAMASLGSTLEQVLLAVRELAGRSR